MIIVVDRSFKDNQWYSFNDQHVYKVRFLASVMALVMAAGIPHRSRSPDL